MSTKSWQDSAMIARLEKDVWGTWKDHLDEVKGRDYIHVDGYRYLADELRARMLKRAEAQEFAD